MGDILPRPAGAFPFKCAEGHCDGQPEKTGKFEIGAPLRRKPEQRTRKCQLQFQAKIHTVQFVARQHGGICKKMFTKP
ncbi:MAG: hypothetical protein Q8N89_16775 [Azonexus sp.]|nr:hypothetical protein [Azonexus sp.]